MFARSHSGSRRKFFPESESIENRSCILLGILFLHFSSRSNYWSPNDNEFLIDDQSLFSSSRSYPPRWGALRVTTVHVYIVEYMWRRDVNESSQNPQIVQYAHWAIASACMAMNKQGPWIELERLRGLLRPFCLSWRKKKNDMTTCIFAIRR